jgi:site-specific DNA-methyltransferase (adenine-specific)
MYSNKTIEWSTPQDFFNILDREFNFTLDPCATLENAKCKKFYTIQDDGLKQSWKYETVFCNPPYEREISKWVKKCYDEGQFTTVVMLIPSRTDTQYFHKYIYQKADEIRFIPGRIKFGNSKNSAPFPSMIVVYGSIFKYIYR